MSRYPYRKWKLPDEIAKIKVKDKSKCPKCGLYGCICQLSLEDWI